MAKPKSPRKGSYGTEAGGPSPAPIDPNSTGGTTMGIPMKEAGPAVGPPTIDPPAIEAKSIDTRKTRAVNGRTKASPTAKAEARSNLVPINIEDEIRQLAYLFSERRGFIPGHETEDWVNAEHEVRQRYHQQRA